MADVLFGRSEPGGRLPTTWPAALTDVPVTHSRTAGSLFIVRVHLRNTGERPGREVVQVYVARPDFVVERPAQWFGGYAAVHTDAKQTAIADVVVSARAMRNWSPEDKAWRTEPGPYRLIVG
ncbi:fibronectin type III-like domain-contianing protein [Streptomyces anulatus]|uniref:fibronectin type III-like domain-contianing protein n=1 Tax=Streptomyces anulatus TaxID=1892 RepID=UPI0033C49CED